MFLLKLSSFLCRKVSTLNQGLKKERLTVGILLVSLVFGEVVSRNDGFGEFAAVGSLHKKAQDYFLEVLWKAIEENFVEACGAIQARHPGIKADNMNPYMTKAGAPNVFSFFHLSYQSISADFVHPFSLH
jgi:hypothetical protein